VHAQGRVALTRATLFNDKKGASGAGMAKRRLHGRGVAAGAARETDATGETEVILITHGLGGIRSGEADSQKTDHNKNSHKYSPTEQVEHC